MFYFQKLLFILVTFAGLSTPIQYPLNLPGWENFAGCIQTSLGGECPDASCLLLFDINCGTYQCACNHFPDSASVVSSLAVSFCTDTTDIASATSLWSEFCAELLSPTVNSASTPTLETTTSYSSPALTGDTSIPASSGPSTPTTGPSSDGPTTGASSDSPTTSPSPDGLTKPAEIGTIIGTIIAFILLILAFIACARD